MNTFMLSIVTDQKIIFSGQAEFCSMITASGSIGFKAFHEPFFGILQNNSEFSYIDDAGKTISLSIESGFVLFRDNVCSVTGIISE